MEMRKSLTLASLGVILTLGTGACASDSDSGSSTDAGSLGVLPQIVVTTNILGDVVSQAVGDLADVEVIMPLGSDPHDFAPSARQAEAMETADLLVINGAGFEEGMLDIIANVEDSGTETFTFADHVELLELDDDHEQVDVHEGDQAADDDSVATADERGGADPHIWTDPSRVIEGVTALAAELATVDGIDADALDGQVKAYVAELKTLDANMEQTLATVADDQRVLITNHEVFSYFADRFGFEVVGAVVPSLTTNSEASAGEIEALADLMRESGTPAIFTETTQSTQLADAIAESVGDDVAVVELFTESLGEAGSGAETYILMMSINASLIADALS